MKFNNMTVKRFISFHLIITFIIVLAISYYGSYASNLHASERNEKVATGSPVISRTRRVTRREAASEVECSQSKFDIDLHATFTPKFYLDEVQKFNYCAYLLAQFSILAIAAMVLFVRNIRLWVVKSIQFTYKQVYLHYVHLKDGKKDAVLVNFAF